MADEENTDVDVEDQDVEPEEMSDEEKLMAKLQEGLEVELHEVGPLRRKLDISIPRALIDEQMGEQFDELKREAAVPGFRRGRAPLRLVQKRFGHDVGDQVTVQLVSNGYLAAVKKLELNTLGDPLVWANVSEEGTDESGMHKTMVSEKLVSIEESLDHLRLPNEGDFSFSCEVELRPEFELPELDGIPVEKPVRTITDDDVDAEIKRMLAFRGHYAPVEGQPVEADDLVVGDAKVVVGDDTIKTEANAMLAARDQRYQGLQLNGLGDALVGKKTGDLVQLEVTFPDDHDTPDLRGKGGTFELTVRDIKRLVIPELTPELLGELGYDDETDLREALKTGLEQRLQGDIKEIMRGQITSHLLNNTDFELPASLSQRQADSIARRRMIEMFQAGVPQAEVEKRVDELRVRAAEEAASDLKLFFVMDKIAEKQGIDVSEDEINGAIASIASMQGKRFDRVRDELIKNDAMNALYLRIRDAKILDSLLESAEVTEQQRPKKTRSGSQKPQARKGTK